MLIKRDDLDMKPTPLVSIGLFVYNGESFLEDAVCSILSQTFRNFELIISDNASTDRTREIAQAYARRDRRIRYYRNEKNMGGGWNARRVCELATGKYFRWATADDMLEPDLLRQCVQALEGDPACVVAYPKTKIVDEQGNLIEYHISPVKPDSPDPVVRLGEFLKDHFCFEIFGLMRMSVLRQVPPMGSFVNGDGILLAQLAVRGRFCECPEYLFISRRHSGQSVRTLPVRLKRPGFRLTRRNTTLPGPEWWDPAKARSPTFPEFRQLRELILLIYNAPLSLGQKLRCQWLVLSWTKRHFRRLAKDLLIAVDLILYNVQVRKTVAADSRRAAVTGREAPP
jgi:glycosyltransferase involved in cell wall biosynthesis